MLVYDIERSDQRYLRLAVTAPGSVELDENVLLVVNDNLLVVLAHNNGDWALLGLGDGLRLDAGVNLAVQNVLDELADLLGVELLGLVVGVLGVLAGLLDGEGGEVLGLQVQVAGVGTKQLGVQGNNVDVSAVLLGDGAEVLSELLALLGGLSEDIGQRDTSLNRLLVSTRSSRPNRSRGFQLRTAIYIE